jgi:hypothetical protein
LDGRTLDDISAGAECAWLQTQESQRLHEIGAGRLLVELREIEHWLISSIIFCGPNGLRVKIGELTVEWLIRRGTDHIGELLCAARKYKAKSDTLSRPRGIVNRHAEKKIKNSQKGKAD